MLNLLDLDLEVDLLNLLLILFFSPSATMQVWEEIIKFSKSEVLYGFTLLFSNKLRLGFSNRPVLIVGTIGFESIIKIVN